MTHAIDVQSPPTLYLMLKDSWFSLACDVDSLFQALRFKVDTDTRVAIVGPNGVGTSLFAAPVLSILYLFVFCFCY